MRRIEEYSAGRPNEWGAVQGRFRAAYNSDSSVLPRTEVHWRLLLDDSPALGGPIGLLVSVMWAVSRLLRGRLVNATPLLAVWSNDAATGALADIVFEVAPIPEVGEGAGTLVGELAANAALCVESSSGEVLWPTYNPRKLTVGTPRR